MSTRMDNYPGLHEDNTNSTYCEQCGCRITGGQCQHGIRPPDKVRNSPQGCNGCLWAGCECKGYSLYDPDDKGGCKAWAYYD